MRGIFSGVVTDGTRAYAFRDHLGYGLLFYRHDEGGFYAATEAKQVVAGAGIPHQPDLDVVERIFFNTYDDDTPCALRGVRRLPKSHGISAGPAGIRLRRYWDPEALLESARIPDDELDERFAQLMDQAVSRCLTGADADLAQRRDRLARRHGIRRAAARRGERASRSRRISAVYPRYPSVDERPYIELLATHFQIPLHTFEQQANILDDLGALGGAGRRSLPGSLPGALRGGLPAGARARITRPS